VSACSGSLVNLDAGNGFANYLWNNLSTTQKLVVTASGKYSVKVTDAYGCKNSDTVNVTFASCTGIEENQLAAHISVYPNPAKDMLVVKNNSATDAVVMMSNMIGERLMNKDVRINSNSYFTIDMRNFASGIYLLQVEQNNTIVTKKVVKE